MCSDRTVIKFVFFSSHGGSGMVGVAVLCCRSNSGLIGGFCGGLLFCVIRGAHIHKHKQQESQGGESTDLLKA